MKKVHVLFMLLFVFCTGFVQKANAQWKDWEWATYGIGFKAPLNFDLKQNDRKAFTASGAIFTMSVKPWEDATITKPIKICQEAMDITPGTDKKVISEEAISNLNGLQGYEAYCTAYQNGKLMHMVIGGYLNPDNSTNFTVQLLFWDDPEQNDLNWKAALYILESFKVI